MSRGSVFFAFNAYIWRLPQSHRDNLKPPSHAAQTRLSLSQKKDTTLNHSPSTFCSFPARKHRCPSTHGIHTLDATTPRKAEFESKQITRQCSDRATPGHKTTAPPASRRVLRRQEAGHPRMRCRRPYVVVRRFSFPRRERR